MGQIFPMDCMQQERERVGRERERERDTGVWQEGREITEKILTMILICLTCGVIKIEYIFGC